MKLQFQKVENGRYPYDLLLLADETKDAIDKYVFKSEVFEVFHSGEKVGVFCLYEIDDNTIELKNIAVSEKYQSQGFGAIIINFIKDYTHKHYKTLIVGTADTGERQIKFYERNGFVKYGIRENFFIENYPEPIIENGRQLKDMVMLHFNLNEE